MLNLSLNITEGHIAQLGDLKTFESGKKVINFTVANNQSWTTDGEKKEKAVFVDMKAWGPQAEFIAKYLKKGSFVRVQGALDQDEWESEGKKHRKLFVLVERVDTLPKDKE